MSCDLSQFCRPGGRCVSIVRSYWVTTVASQRYGSQRPVLECTFISFFLVRIQILQKGDMETSVLPRVGTVAS